MTSGLLGLTFKGRPWSNNQQAKKLASLPIIQEGIHFQDPFLTMGENIQIHFPKNVFIVVKITTF